jgi:hypothetical protein
MKRSELENLIEQEIYSVLQEMELAEKSVPEPYNKKERRKMKSSQVKKRDKIGKAMKKNPNAVKRFKEKHGADWESYLWAAATNKSFGGE